MFNTAYDGAKPFLRTWILSAGVRSLRTVATRILPRCNTCICQWLRRLRIEKTSRATRSLCPENGFQKIDCGKSSNRLLLKRWTVRCCANTVESSQRFVASARQEMSATDIGTFSLSMDATRVASCRRSTKPTGSWSGRTLDSLPGREGRAGETFSPDSGYVWRVSNSAPISRWLSTPRILRPSISISVTGSRPGTPETFT